MMMMMPSDMETPEAGEVDEARIKRQKRSQPILIVNVNYLDSDRFQHF